MKNYLIKFCIGCSLVILIAGCGGGEEEAEQRDPVKDSLINALNIKNSAIDSFINSFNEIESNLNAIREKESVIRMSSGSDIEMKKDVKERINEDIESINTLMDENRQKIADLNEKLRKAGGKAGALEKMIKNLNIRLEEKERELAGLKLKLDSLNTTVAILHTSIDTLSVQNESKSKIINEQTSKLNTAYYAVGKYKMLKEKNVLNKEGGFLGLGKEEVLKKDFNTEYFTQIDITKTKIIPIMDKKAKLLTSHPSDSYRFDTNDNKVLTSLVITNSDKFWKTSKYLVIVTE